MVYYGTTIAIIEIAPSARILSMVFAGPLLPVGLLLMVLEERRGRTRKITIT